MKALLLCGGNTINWIYFAGNLLYRVSYRFSCCLHYWQMIRIATQKPPSDWPQKEVGHSVFAVWIVSQKTSWRHRGMNTRGKNWLLWKGPTVCHFIYVLCHNFGMETFRGQWHLVDTIFHKGRLLVDIPKGWLFVDTFGDISWAILVRLSKHCSVPG